MGTCKSWFGEKVVDRQVEVLAGGGAVIWSEQPGGSLASRAAHAHCRLPCSTSGDLECQLTRSAALLGLSISCCNHSLSVSSAQHWAAWQRCAAAPPSSLTRVTELLLQMMTVPSLLARVTSSSSVNTVFLFTALFPSLWLRNEELSSDFHEHFCFDLEFLCRWLQQQQRVCSRSSAVQTFYE